MHRGPLPVEIMENLLFSKDFVLLATKLMFNFTYLGVRPAVTELVKIALISDLCKKSRHFRMNSKLWGRQIQMC